MEKPPAKPKERKLGATFGGRKVLGVTKDGVQILKPRARATHFTRKEIREAIALARSAKRA